MTIHAPSRSHADQAFAALAAGEPVVVADDREGHLVFAAALATPALLAFTVRHTSGFVRVAMTAEDCRRLDLPPMHYRGDPAQRVTVDRRGPGTASCSCRSGASISTKRPETRRLRCSET
jgi:3,4-dihydroxy 2-butanone 4-phosphate synthase/GTP cyclohydrolase II